MANWRWPSGGVGWVLGPGGDSCRYNNSRAILIAPCQVNKRAKTHIQNASKGRGGRDGARINYAKRLMT